MHRPSLVTGGADVLGRTLIERFAGRGAPWVVMLPPYNEHLMRDVGALMMAYSADPDDWHLHPAMEAAVERT